MVQTFVDAGVVGRIEGGHIGGHERAKVRRRRSVCAFPVHPRRDAVTLMPPATLPPADSIVNTCPHWLTSPGRPRLGQDLPPTPGRRADSAERRRAIARLPRCFMSSRPACAIIEATQTQELVGAVNTWVPILDHFHRDYDFFRDRQKAGDEVWFYTCCEPTGNYANRFIELPLIKTRLLHWINFRYGATGYLHWGFNYWNASSPFEETAFQWPGGDQWIVYPKDGKLLSSIRLEAMRDGIGDNELLSMLAERNRDAAQKLAAEMIVDFDRYDTDIARFRARRLRLLEAVSASR